MAELFGYRVKEVPIRWRDDGDSRLQLVMGNLNNVKDIFRIRLSRSRYQRSDASLIRAKASAQPEI
jgi:hypothetical protein